MEIEIALRKHELPFEFSPKVAAETKALPDKVRKTEWDGRKDIRDLPLVTIDGETRRRADWLALIGLTKQGLHKAACRAGRELSEELTLRVRARRSDAAHAPASSVASDQRRGMVSRAGAVSACVASGSGANDTREVAA